MFYIGPVVQALQDLDVDPEGIRAVISALNANARELDDGSFQRLHISPAVFGGSETAAELGFHHGKAHQIVVRHDPRCRRGPDPVPRRCRAGRPSRHAPPTRATPPTCRASRPRSRCWWARPAFAEGDRREQASRNDTSPRRTPTGAARPRREVMPDARGPQEARLDRAVSGAARSAIQAAEEEWRNGARSLDNVAMALEMAGPQVIANFGGTHTGPAAQQAFRKVAAKVRARKEQMEQAADALAHADVAVGRGAAGPAPRWVRSRPSRRGPTSPPAPTTPTRSASSGPTPPSWAATTRRWPTARPRPRPRPTRWTGSTVTPPRRWSRSTGSRTPAAVVAPAASGGGGGGPDHGRLVVRWHRRDHARRHQHTQAGHPTSATSSTGGPHVVAPTGATPAVITAPGTAQDGTILPPMSSPPATVGASGSAPASSPTGAGAAGGLAGALGGGLLGGAAGIGGAVRGGGTTVPGSTARRRPVDRQQRPDRHRGHPRTGRCHRRLRVDRGHVTRRSHQLGDRTGATGATGRAGAARRTVARAAWRWDRPEPRAAAAGRSRGQDEAPGSGRAARGWRPLEVDTQRDEDRRRPRRPLRVAAGLGRRRGRRSRSDRLASGGFRPGIPAIRAVACAAVRVGAVHARVRGRVDESGAGERVRPGPGHRRIGDPPGRPRAAGRRTRRRAGARAGPQRGAARPGHRLRRLPPRHPRGPRAGRRRRPRHPGRRGRRPDHGHRRRRRRAARGSTTTSSRR